MVESPPFINNEYPNYMKDNEYSE
ncbi:hypothetical protein XIS1_480016 [Xenorhabdus innexi]|uniref:Uncharacterized protein n=1 Tax=Xenorhabdus innexi TaxID=290109 RepID=A0A1N6MYK1_9GAMM|nr:hypothetical protein XIS1_480016 [Xenorhabdus innexi]